jgi:DNA-binding MarR family transcriptional regulator
MQNKTVIRKKNKPGHFTTIHYSILLDKRLKSNDKIVLILILSDADTFNLTQQSLINRLDLEKTAIKTVMKNLEKFGYLKRKEKKRGHYYTISEYGNLSSSTEIEETTTLIVTEIPELDSEEINIDAPSPIIEETFKPLNLDDYQDKISYLMPPNLPDENIIQILEHFIHAIDKRTLNNPNQMTEDNIKKIIAKYVPAEIEVKKISKAKLSEICDQNSFGSGMTQENKKIIKKQIISYFSENPTNSVNEVETKILKLKMNFSKVGHLDQRYQN